VLPTARGQRGEELPDPETISFTMVVPAAVPSLFQSAAVDSTAKRAKLEKGYRVWNIENEQTSASS